MSLLLLFLFLSLLPSFSLSSPFNYSLHIDCGGLVNSTDAFRTTWLSDRFYSGAPPRRVRTPPLSHQQEKTLRYFPSPPARKLLLHPDGQRRSRYLLRAFTVYDNYDGKSHSPSFDVSVEGTLVFSWRSLGPNHIATDSPAIGSLELTQIDPKAYSFEYAKNSSNYILVNYGRFSSGSDQWGPGFSNDTDFFGRSWQSDAEFRLQAVSIVNGATIKEISAVKPIANVEISPNYFPEKLYQTAITALGNGGGILEYELPVDAKLDYLLWFHFAEIDEVGGFAAFDWSYVVKNLSSTTLNVRLESVVGAPIICGLENYAIVPVDLKLFLIRSVRVGVSLCATKTNFVTAMRALKSSLRVPDRMGWNGDPCAPTTWDAWEGVTCHLAKDESALVVSQMNLSSNSLGGSIPSGLGQKSLVKLDLSNNKLTGYIPDSLTSSSLQLVLAGNKGLCGVPSLPNCPLFWGKHGLSTGGKVGVALSCLLVLSALLFGIYYCVIRRRRNDYDFGLPHELMSLAAKRNRYHRQKSLMALEMESQHAKGFIPTYNVS
ncbi:UNVERIFIED_CONTAM: Receptor-like protein 4 [Sesamum calycinum]|uniref:Receptor-like protein 4 n=1 Tax=Sesamum calycinum TaxID=2727403 RepID=A0AAW2SZ23_9LAMI